MFKSRTRVLVILVCFSFLLLCSTLVFCSQTQNFAADVDVFYTAPKGSQFLKYSLNSNQDGWICTGYDESKRNGETTVDIPDMHTQDGKTLPVTEISYSAFKEAQFLKVLTIGQNISKIGFESFRDCKYLVEINYNATSVQDLTSVSSSPNTFCNAGYYSNGLSLVIGNNVTRIPSRLFGYSISNPPGYPRITSLTIGDHVTEIASYAFGYCYQLRENLIIPDSVKTIDGGAFWNCGITSVKFGTGLTNIGNYAFGGCYSISGVLTIPNSVTFIGSDAFKGCFGLTGVILPNKLSQIGWDTFNGCTSLRKLTIPSSVTTIGTGAFYGCSGLTGNLTIPSSVTTIESGAFENCSGLESLTFEKSVKTLSIGQWVFGNCGFTTVTIPGNVTMDTHVFDSCSKLENLTIEEGVTIIPDYAFSECDALNRVYISSTVTEIKQYAFYLCYVSEIIVDSRAIYNSIYKGVSSAGCLFYYIESGCRINILQSVDDNSKSYLNDYFYKSTTTINGKKYNVYTKP